MKHFTTQIMLLVISGALLLSVTPIPAISQEQSTSARKSDVRLPGTHTKALTDWRNKRINKLVLNFRYLSPEQKAKLAEEYVGGQIKVGDFLTQGSTGLGDIIIKRELVDGLEKLTDRIKQGHPEATLQWASGYRSPSQHEATSKKVSGSASTRGPHVRGNAIDIAFSIPGKSSEESAKILAQKAKELGVKGISIDKNSSTESYSCHLDFVRKDEWYVRQVWETDEKTKVRKAVYREVDTLTWELPGVEGAEQARERNELLQVKALVDKGAINRDSLSPPMREKLKQFEATQTIIGNSVKNKSAGDKSEEPSGPIFLEYEGTGASTSNPPSNLKGDDLQKWLETHKNFLKQAKDKIALQSGAPAKPPDELMQPGKEQELSKWLAKHPELLKRVLENNLPPEAKDKPILISDQQATSLSQIPRGWIECQCPFSHPNLGIFVKDGDVVRQFHSPDFRCP